MHLLNSLRFQFGRKQRDLICNDQRAIRPLVVSTETDRIATIEHMGRCGSRDQCFDETRCEIDKNCRMVARDRRIGVAHLALAISTVIIGAHQLTMSIPAQGATGRITSCKSEYVCRRVRANPLRTKPNPAMVVRGAICGRCCERRRGEWAK
jgi:hypothetical protein